MAVCLAGHNMHQPLILFSRYRG